jgi:hypothetical protein
MLDLFVEKDTGTAFSHMLRAAQCYSLELYVVTRDYFHHGDNVHLILAESPIGGGGIWIAGNIGGDDICVTGDPGVATICMMRGAIALEPSGRPWTADIGTPSVAVPFPHLSILDGKTDGPKHIEMDGLFRCLAKAIAATRRRAGLMDGELRRGPPRATASLPGSICGSRSAGAGPFYLQTKGMP